MSLKSTNTFHRVNKQKTNDPQRYPTHHNPDQIKNLCESTQKLQNQSIQYLLSHSIDSGYPTKLVIDNQNKNQSKKIPQQMIATQKRTSKPPIERTHFTNTKRRYKSITVKKGFELIYINIYIYREIEDKNNKPKHRSNLSFSQSHHYSKNHFHCNEEQIESPNEYINISHNAYKENIHDINWMSKHSLAEKHFESVQNFKSDKNLKLQKGNPDFLEGKRMFGEGRTQEAQQYGGILFKKQGSLKKLLPLTPIIVMLEFEYLIRINPSHKKHAYILMAIIYKKQNNSDGSLQILTRAIQKFPKYYDAYIYRGKLQIRLKQWQRALDDFNQAIKIQPTKAIGFIGQAESLKFLNRQDEAIQAYSKAIDCQDSMKNTALIKRAIIYIEMKSYQLAYDDIIQLDDESNSSEALYFKGYVLSKLQKIQDAILCYEQAIKHNNSRKAVTKSLYEIARINIEQRDYYSAFHQLSRSDLLDVDRKSLEKFIIFTDGVTFLMKRKYKEGLDNLTTLVEKFSLNDFLTPLIFTYRAYGFICESKFNKALKDLQTVEKNQPIDDASKYNKLICEGIISAQDNQFEQSLNFFVQASKLVPNKMEPLFYRAMALVKFSNKLIESEDKQKKEHFVIEALKYLNKAVMINDSNANLLFYRGVLLYFLGNLSEALLDLDKAIEKSEDNIPKHFYIRGMVHFALESHKLALNDFSIAINLNELYTEAYVNRSKVFYILGDKSNAYYDAKKVTTIKQADGNQILQSANMYFMVGAYDDAIKLYSTLLVSSKNQKEILGYRSNCFMTIKELNNALSDLDKIQGCQQNMNAKTSNNKSIVKLSNDQKSVVDFQILSSLKNTSSQNNVEGYLDAINHIDQILSSQAEGNNFKLSDILFYKAVFNFYAGDLQACYNLLKQSYSVKQKETPIIKTILNTIELDTPLDSSRQEEDPQLIFDETYNESEFQYNLALIDIKLGNVTGGIQRLKNLKQSINSEEIKQNLQKLIDCESGISVFPEHNRLCSIFPALQLQINGIAVECRLSFCLPSIRKPQIACTQDEKFWLTLCPNVVENKPEAPWIKRNADGVVFTDDLQIIDDLDLRSEMTSQKQLDVSI